jgi:transporter family protein
MNMWWIYALFSAFFAALTAIFAKIGVENVNSNLATAIRTIVVLVMIWLIVFFRQEYKGIGELSQRNWIFLTISGFATGLSWIFYFKALQMGEVSKVAGIDKLSLALTIIFAIIFLGETLSWKTAVGAGLIIAGSLFLIWK